MGSLNHIPVSGSVPAPVRPLLARRARWAQGARGQVLWGRQVMESGLTLQ